MRRLLLASFEEIIRNGADLISNLLSFFHYRIIGRGKQVDTHSGNIRFQELIDSMQYDYSVASSKSEKTSIILSVVNQVKGGFIKRHSGSKRWYKVEESIARMTVAQAFRNGLSGCYRSSKQFKRSKRLNSLLDKKRDSVTNMAKSLMPAHMFSLQEARSMQLASTPPVPTDFQQSFGLDKFPCYDRLQGSSRTVEDKLGDVLARRFEEISSVCDLTTDPFEPTPLGPVASQATTVQNTFKDFFSSPIDYQLEGGLEYPELSFSLQDPLLW